MKYTLAHSPKWANVDHTMIELFVVFESIGEVPFSAHSNDCEAHGREIFARAVAGDFGPIAEYMAPVKSAEQIKGDKLSQIAAIESANSLPRPVREAMLMMLPEGIQKEKIKAIDDQIAAIRATL